MMLISTIYVVHVLRVECRVRDSMGTGLWYTVPGTSVRYVSCAPYCYSTEMAVDTVQYILDRVSWV